MKTNLDVLIEASENVSAIFRRYGEIADRAYASYVAALGPAIRLVDSYNAAMAPINDLVASYNAAIRRIFPLIEENNDE